MTHENSLQEILKKLEYYCSYQERCHAEVVQKLFALKIPIFEQDKIVVHLIEHNFLNEERFAIAFAIGKFHQKKWGKIRIKNELKLRAISNYLITKAIQSIDDAEYLATFEFLFEKTCCQVLEKNKLKRKKKIQDYLVRKGWESDLIFSKLKEF